MAEQDTQQQLDRLQKARAKADEAVKEKARLTGELGALDSQIGDLEAKIKNDFGCDVTELPVFVKQLKDESETALYNAEVILGIREGQVKTPQAPTPQVSEPSPSQQTFNRASKTVAPPRVEDADSLM